MLHLRARLLQLGGIYADLRLGGVAAGERGEIIAVRVIQSLVADDAFLVHFHIAVEGGLVHGQVGGGGVDFVLSMLASEVPRSPRRWRVAPARLDLGCNLLLIELRQFLALAHPVVDVDVELLTMPEALD